MMPLEADWLKHQKSFFENIRVKIPVVDKVESIAQRTFTGYLCSNEALNLGY